MSVFKKFVEKKLTTDDINKWLREQGQIKFLCEKEALTEDNLTHIAKCMHSIYLAYHNIIPPTGLGHFLTAIIQNDLAEACRRADRTNRLVLPLYAMFLYNCVPIDYREKMRGR